MLDVLVYSGELRGHEPQYLLHSASALANLPGARLTIALPQSARQSPLHPELAFAETLGATLDFSTPPLPNSGFRNAAGRFESLRKVIARYRPDYVFIPSGDLLIHATTAWRAFPWGRLRKRPILDGIVHGCRFVFSDGDRMRSLKNAVSLRLLAAAPTETIKLLSFDAIQHLRDVAPRYAARFELVPCLVEASAGIYKEEARKAWDLPAEGRIVGCVGQLSERKGIDLLLRAFMAARLRPDDRLLLVGRLSPPIRELIESQFSAMVTEKRLLVFDRFVTQEEMTAAICAMDLVCTPYRAQYDVASILLKASILGRPVLASRSRWPSVAVHSFGLGATCDVYDIDAFASAIQRNLDTAASFRSSPFAERLAAYHAPKNFAAHITRKPREMLGLPASSDFRSWEIVVNHGPDQ